MEKETTGNAFIFLTIQLTKAVRLEMSKSLNSGIRKMAKINRCSMP